MLILSVENFLRRHALSPSLFGREAARDPRLVSDMRGGRAPREALDQRLRGFMDGFEFARRYPPIPLDPASAARLREFRDAL